MLRTSFKTLKSHGSRGFNAKERSGKVGKYTHHTNDFSSTKTEQPYARQQGIGKLSETDLQEVRKFKQDKFGQEKRLILPPGSSKSYSLVPQTTITVPAVGGPRVTYKNKNYAVNPLVRLKNEKNKGLSYDGGVVKKDYIVAKNALFSQTTADTPIPGADMNMVSEQWNNSGYLKRRSAKHREKSLSVTIKPTETLTQYFKFHESWAKALPELDKDLLKILDSQLQNNKKPIKPTDMQVEILKNLLKNENHATIFGHMGSGKTLAILLNMVQKYRVYKELDKDFDADASLVECRAPMFIYVTTGMLQSNGVENEYRKFFGYEDSDEKSGGDFPRMHRASGLTMKQIVENKLKRRSDILVLGVEMLRKLLDGEYKKGEGEKTSGNESACGNQSTPGNQSTLNLSRLRGVVFDECAELLDKSFENSTTSVLRHINDRNLRGQKISLQFVNGINSTELNEKINDIFAEIEDPSVLTPEMLDPNSEYSTKAEILEISRKNRDTNLMANHITHEFIRKLSRQQATQHMVDMVSKKKCPRTVIFANSKKQAKYLYIVLKTAGVKNLGYWSKSLPKNEWFSSFESNVLVATEGLSFGIDFGGFNKYLGNVELVINVGLYEPSTGYMQRAGRIGRAGVNSDSEAKKCKIVTFVWEPQHFLAMQPLEECFRRKIAFDEDEAIVDKRNFYEEQFQQRHPVDESVTGKPHLYNKKKPTGGARDYGKKMDRGILNKTE